MTNHAYREAGQVDAGEPVEHEGTAADMQQIAEDKLELLGASLASTRDKWVNARVATGVERRWLEDLDQYLGRDVATKMAADMMEAVENGGVVGRKPDAKIQRSTVFVNITRPKTNAVEARLANMLFPNDDRAWGIKPTPNPLLVKKALEESQALAAQWQQMGAAAPQGAPGSAPQGAQPMAQPTPAQVPGVEGGMQPAANETVKLPEGDQHGNVSPLGVAFIKTPAVAEMEAAMAKAKAMEMEIDDALTECDYSAEARKMIHDLCVLGTGVMKGPIVVNRVAKVWEKIGTAYVLNVKELLKPASECVSPWHVYPDPTCGNDIHNGKGIWEKKNLTAKMLRELVDQPGYMPHQIQKALARGPRRATTINERDRRDQALLGQNELMYEAWEYWGEFDVDDLRACGVEIKDDAIKVLSGCVIMVNDIVIKGFVNPLDSGALPYDFIVMEEADNLPWGYGMPFLMRPAQKVLNAAWRQMMDNAGLAVGPQIFLKRNIIEPADKNWQITGRKIWNILDDSVDADKAVLVHDIPFKSEYFEKIIQLAMTFADEESSVPKIMQGQAQSNAVGVNAMEEQNSNVILGRMVKNFDDRITKRHIRRYYDFFMAYSEKDEIKGDYQVDARGSSVLLVRAQQIQSLMQFGQFQGTAVGQMVHWHKWLREILKVQNLNPYDILKSDAEIEQLINQPPPPNPEQMKSETAIQVAQIKAEAQFATSQAKEQAELAFANSQAQMARDNNIAKLKELEMKRDLALLEYSMKQQITLEQTKAQLAQTAIVEETKRQLGAAKLQQDGLEKDKDRMSAATQPQQPQGGANA